MNVSKIDYLTNPPRSGATNFNQKRIEKENLKCGVPFQLHHSVVADSNQENGYVSKRKQINATFLSAPQFRPLTKIPITLTGLVRSEGKTNQVISLSNSGK